MRKGVLVYKRFVLNHPTRLSIARITHLLNVYVMKVQFDITCVIFIVVTRAMTENYSSRYSLTRVSI